MHSNRPLQATTSSSYRRFDGRPSSTTSFPTYSPSTSMTAAPITAYSSKFVTHQPSSFGTQPIINHQPTVSSPQQQSTTKNPPNNRKQTEKSTEGGAAGSPCQRSLSTSREAQFQSVKRNNSIPMTDVGFATSEPGWATSSPSLSQQMSPTLQPMTTTSTTSYYPHPSVSSSTSFVGHHTGIVVDQPTNNANFRYYEHQRYDNPHLVNPQSSVIYTQPHPQHHPMSQTYWPHTQSQAQYLPTYHQTGPPEWYVAPEQSLPILSLVTYNQAEIFPKPQKKKERQTNEAANKSSQQNSPEPSTAAPSPSLQLNEENFEKILKMPSALQTTMMKLIEQQNEIQLLELQLRLKNNDTSKKSNATSPSTKASEPQRRSFNGAATSSSPPRRSTIQRTKSPPPEAPQQPQQKQQTQQRKQQAPSLGRSSSFNRNAIQLKRQSSSASQQRKQSEQQEEPSAAEQPFTGAEHNRPRKLSVSQLLGLKGKEPITLEEIKSINAENLRLTTNTHLPDSMAAKKPDGPKGLQFSDVDEVKKTLMAMNPGWTGSPEELMGAMQAHLAGQPVTFSNATASQAAPPQVAMGAAMPQRQVDEGFKNVCHVQTHSLQIDYVDENTGDHQSRDVPVVQIYRDPPISVMSDFFSQSECDGILSLTNSHWEAIDAQFNNTDPEKPQLSSRIKGIAKLPRGQSELVDRLLRRAAAACQACVNEIEEVFILRYQAGMNTKEHLEPITRRSTLLVYLNEVAVGGETDFVRLGFQIRPQCGTGVLWHNVKVNSTDPATGVLNFDYFAKEPKMVHSSLPVRNNEVKYAVVFYVKNNKLCELQQQQQRQRQQQQQSQESLSQQEQLAERVAVDDSKKSLLAPVMLEESSGSSGQDKNQVTSNPGQESSISQEANNNNDSPIDVDDIDSSEIVMQEDPK